MIRAASLLLAASLSLAATAPAQKPSGLLEALLRALAGLFGKKV